jgi:hypothetical protein
MFPKPWTVGYVGHDELLVCDATGRKLFYIQGDEGDGDEAKPSALFHGTDKEHEILMTEIERMIPPQETAA